MNNQIMVARGGLNQEEVKKVRSLINKLDSYFFPYSDKFPSSIRLNPSSTIFDDSSIMNLETINYMTPSPNVFFTYSPCPSSEKIATTYSSLKIVLGAGDVEISPSLILKYVLHIPKLSINLCLSKRLLEINTAERFSIIVHGVYLMTWI